MAGEWIKIRAGLSNCPRVAAIARAVGEGGGPCYSALPRQALRLMTIGGLHAVWSAVNEHTADGVMVNAHQEDLDDISGLAGFGDALASVGWLVVDAGAKTLTFPNFDQWNTCGKDVTAAERMRKHRAKQAVTRNGRNVTRNGCAGVTVDKTRQDKRREEEIQPAAPDAPTETRKPRSRSQPTDSIRWTPAAGWEGITAEDRAAWAAAYPACDVARELAAAGEWLRANPEKARKSRWRSFLVRWLSRSQDRGGGKPSNRPGAPPPAKAWAERPSWRDDACRNLTDAQYREWLKTQNRSQEPQEAARGVAVPPADSVDPF
jgi:hypothetical protein